MIHVAGETRMLYDGTRISTRVPYRVMNVCIVFAPTDGHFGWFMEKYKEWPVTLEYLPPRPRGEMNVLIIPIVGEFLCKFGFLRGDELVYTFPAILI